MALKIKDDVDLKELEKFGFRKTQFDDYYKLVSNDDYFWVDINTRVLDYTTPKMIGNLDDVIDLCKKLDNAGLVEKIGE